MTWPEYREYRRRWLAENETPAVRAAYNLLVGSRSVHGPIPEPSFTCPRCKMTSHNPNDIREGYCGSCHAWTGWMA
jgi:hypothetical protein